MGKYKEHIVLLGFHLVRQFRVFWTSTRLELQTVRQWRTLGLELLKTCENFCNNYFRSRNKFSEWLVNYSKLRKMREASE